MQLLFKALCRNTDSCAYIAEDDKQLVAFAGTQLGHI